MMNKQRVKALLRHGNMKKVADTAGVSTAAVTKFFNDEIKSSSKIYKAALEVVIENNKELKKLEIEFQKIESIA